jgi:hypothetical protein
MAARQLPDAKTLRNILNYDPETGILSWRKRPIEHFAANGPWKTWNIKYAGKRAGAIALRGKYINISLTMNGRRYTPLAHRVAWAIMTGEWPAYEIDHSNGNGTDNRWDNLRQATRGQNCQNTHRRKDNVSGFKGVHWNSSRRKWTTRVRVSGKSIHIGFFAEAEDAYAAYCALAKGEHGEFYNPG